MAYPIKYAVLEVKEDGGYIQGYKKITLGYIVSKCYVIGSYIRYYAFSESKSSNFVFFPFNNIKDFKFCNPDLIEPDKIRADCYGNPYPIDEVSHLFDTYEEAKENAEEKNDDLRRNLILNRVAVTPMNPDCQKEYDKLVKDFESDLEVCRKYEEFITERTSDMVIDKDKCKVKI